MVNGNVTKTSVHDQSEVIRSIQSIEQLKAVSFLLGMLRAVDDRNKENYFKLQHITQERVNQLCSEYQYIKTGGNIVNPTLVDLSKMKLEESFGDIDHLKSCIINMLSHPGMNIPTANLVGNKIASGIINMEKANIQYNKGYVAKHAERIQKNQYNKLIHNIIKAMQPILQNDRLFNAIVPASILEVSRSI